MHDISLRTWRARSTSYRQVNEYLEKGELSVQLSSVNKSGRISVDQAIEETANREITALRGTKVQEPVLS